MPEGSHPGPGRGADGASDSVGAPNPGTATNAARHGSPSTPSAARPSTSSAHDDGTVVVTSSRLYRLYRPCPASRVSRSAGIFLRDRPRLVPVARVLVYIVLLLMFAHAVVPLAELDDGSDARYEVSAVHPTRDLAPINPRLTHGSPRVAETEQDRGIPQGGRHLGDQRATSRSRPTPRSIGFTRLPTAAARWHSGASGRAPFPAHPEFAPGQRHPETALTAPDHQAVESDGQTEDRYHNVRVRQLPPLQ